MESRFKYNPATTPADTASLNSIAAEIGAQAARLKTDLSTGPARLSQLATAMAARRAASVPFIEVLLKQRAQVLADISALGLTVPDMRPPASTARATPAVGSIQAQAPPMSPSTARCPRCNSLMVIRMAKTGYEPG